MEYRPLGKTGLDVSALGFGCGSIGGLLVRGDYPAMRRTVARAIELGVNYFDTASMYGNGQSEVNLGAVLRELGAHVLVGSKVRLAPEQLEHIEDAVIQSVESSLRRMGRESLDLIQFHNLVGPQRVPGQERATPADVQSVLRAFRSLEQQGKVRYWGITGLGATESLHQVLAAGGLHSMQVCYNLLNPSAGTDVPPGFPYQDFGRLVDRCAGQQVGVVAIRVLAGGALSGTARRDPVAAQSVVPIGTAPDFAADVRQAQRFAFLVADGYCADPVEAAIRFALSKPGVSTALAGISNLEQLEHAVAAAERGPLPADALQRLSAVWSRLAPD
jgi:L-galactose dehydrogenase/L-glyceraldehyde 3-phosphate reductase